MTVYSDLTEPEKQVVMAKVKKAHPAGHDRYEIEDELEDGTRCAKCLMLQHNCECESLIK